MVKCYLFCIVKSSPALGVTAALGEGLFNSNGLNSPCQLCPRCAGTVPTEPPVAEHRVSSQLPPWLKQLRLFIFIFFRESELEYLLLL